LPLACSIRTKRVPAVNNLFAYQAINKTQKLSSKLLTMLSWTI